MSRSVASMLGMSGPQSGSPMMIERRAAGNKGTMSNWNPRRIHEAAMPRTRVKVVERALDLEANDPHVSGLIESINVNTVGSGFRAQAKIKAEQVPLTSSEIDLVQRQLEWEWQQFDQVCDIARKKHFPDFLTLIDRCMLNRGEYLVVTRMKKRPGDRHGLKLQLVDPLRLKTPSDKVKNPKIIDGVEFDDDGAPLAYWIHNNPANPHQLTSENFKRITARHGHRPRVFHGFMEKQPDQVRGEVFFSPAMKFFRDLSDLLDSEVVSNIITSALALFIQTGEPTAAAMAAAGGSSAEKTDSGTMYENWDAGQVLYGRPGEEPHLLSANRPGDNFVPFIETVLRAASSCAGIPYEVAAKKYGDMNYSSARAALLEAWRVFGQRQDWLIRHFCRPIWAMVVEECWLRDYVELPDFYKYQTAYCRSGWIVPPKGHIDPIKEAQANILKLRNHMTTQTDIAAEAGKDWEEDIAAVRGREQQVDRANNLEYPQPKSTEKPSAK